MKVLMDSALEAGWLSPADLHLADHLLRLGGGEATPPARLCIALASAGLRQGHVCLDLEQHPLLAGTDPEPLIRALGGSGVLQGPDGAPAPLVLAGRRLYLARYHHWERQIVDAVRRRLQAPAPPLDDRRLRHDLAALFSGSGVDEAIDWQRVAATLALLRPLCVISGGPGTGKTWTVARILELLQRQPGGEVLRIALAAPTGKAAGRLGAALAEAGVDGLEALTLHRLLGMRPGRVQARFGPDRPLPVDLVVVDEVSMVDLPLMARLAAALPSAARLVLLGDHDQLASVEAGQVMADLCGDDGTAYSAVTAARVAALGGDHLPVAPGPLPPMADHRVVLRRSRRFDPERGIGRLARAVQAGDAGAALAAVDGDQVHVFSPTPEGLLEVLRRELLPLVQSARRAPPERALALMERARVLCALREGPQGVAWCNRQMERLLGVEGQRLYPGRPVMVTVNDHRQRLYNGDVGLVLTDAGGRLQVHFPDPDRPGGVRTLLPGRLPPHETVFAMTIHKSQGSEFDRVVLVLPSQDHPLVTRELVYTGLTRARSAVLLGAAPQVLERALARRVVRSSGLREALWGPDEA